VLRASLVDEQLLEKYQHYQHMNARNKRKVPVATKRDPLKRKQRPFEGFPKIPLVRKTKIEA